MSNFDKWLFKILSYKFLSIWAIVCLVLCFVWIGLEYTLDGQVISQHSDTIMCILLSYLISDKLYGIKEN